MSLPNLITIARILMVPITVWLMISEAFGWAFITFVAAGISDGVDGFIARRFNLKTELGGYLDPLADKALLVSIYVTLGLLKFLPAWLVIMVVTRDLLIVGGVILASVLEQPLEMQPSMVSKVNTAVQIAFAGIVLGLLGAEVEFESLRQAGIALVAGLTLVSGGLYLRAWVRHMANGT